MPLDTLVTGRIATFAGATGFGWVEAVGIRDGVVAFAGSAVDLESRADPHTLRIELEPGELAMPGIVTAAILVFIFAWNDLLLALSLTATERAITAPVAIANFTGSSQFEEPTGSIAAGAMIITVPIIIFVLIFQRRIVAGLTSGAVKG